MLLRGSATSWKKCGARTSAAMLAKVIDFLQQVKKTPIVFTTAAGSSRVG
jgi:hypothetical protein